MSPAALVKRSPLGAYFVLVFGIEWVLFVALLAGLVPALPPLLILLLASWLPDIVGVLVTGISGGRAGLGALFGRVVRWRVGVAWYAVALFVPAMVALGATLLSPIVSGPAPSFAQPDQWFGIVVVGLVTGAIGEELGWRGTALPQLLTRWSAVTSSLLLGSLWGLYHVPAFFVPGLPQGAIPLAAFLIMAVAFSVFITCLFNQTGGSLLLVCIAHFSLNVADNLTGASYWFLAALWTVLAVAIVVYFGPRTFTRRATRPSWNRRGARSAAGAT